MQKSAKAYQAAPSASGHGPQMAKLGRRRRAAKSTSTPPKNQHFYFVDQNSSSKEKRAHVMRHHVQEKRKQRKISRWTSPTEQIPGYTTHVVKNEAGIIEKTRLESPPTSAQDSHNGENSVWESLSSNQVSRLQPRLAYLGVGFAAKMMGLNANITVWHS